MSKWDFVRQCWAFAFTGAWGWLGGVATVAGVLLPLFVFAANRLVLSVERRAVIDRMIASVYFQQAVWAVPLAIGFAILFVRLTLVAPYLILKRETARRDEQLKASQSRIEQLSSVNLSVRIDQYGIGNSDQGGEAGLLMFLSVRNLGIETALEGWTLRIEAPNGIVYEDQPTVLTGPFTAGSATFALGDHLVLKAAKPLERGSITKGILLYMLSPQAATLVRPGAKLMVSCTDVGGTIHTAEHVVTGTPGRDLLTFIPEGRASDVASVEKKR